MVRYLLRLSKEDNAMMFMEFLLVSIVDFEKVFLSKAVVFLQTSVL